MFPNFSSKTTNSTSEFVLQSSVTPRIAGLPSSTLKDDVKSFHRFRLDGISELYKNQIARLKADLQSKKTSHEAELQAKTAQLDNLSQLMLRMKSEHQVEVGHIRAENLFLQTELRSLKDELHRNKTSHEAEIQAKTAQLDNLSQLMLKMKSEHQEEVGRLRVENLLFQTQLTSLKDELHRNKTSHEAEIQAKTAQLDNSSQLMLKMKSEHQEEVGRLIVENLLFQTQLTSLKDELFKTKNNHDAMLQAKSVELDNARQLLFNIKADHQAEVSSLKKILNKILQNEIESIKDKAEEGQVNNTINGPKSEVVIQKKVTMSADKQTKQKVPKKRRERNTKTAGKPAKPAVTCQLPDHRQQLTYQQPLQGCQQLAVNGN